MGENRISLVSSYESPYVYEVDIPRTPVPTLAPHGTIVGHTFPSSAGQGVNLPFDFDVHNTGTEGQIALGVVNVAGNPGNIVITYQGNETVIPPDYYWRVNTVNPVPNCYHIIDSGSIRFENAGNYVIKLWGMWYDAGTWYYNSEEEITKNITVQIGWPVTKPVHIFDDVKLKAEWHDISKAMSRTIINIDTSLLLGGRLDYRVKYTQGMPITEIANIDLNDVNMVSEHLSKGESKSGSIDLTGFIGEEAKITIRFDSSPGIWSEVLFDVWVTFGYSKEPTIDPTVTSNFIEKYGKWIALGTAGIIVLYMMRKPSIIVIGGTK